MKKSKEFAKVAVQFYERSKRLFENVTGNGDAYYRGRTFTGLCAVLDTTRLEKDRRRIKEADANKLNDEIWEAILSAGGLIFFPNNKHRMSFVNKQLKKYNAILNKK